MLSLLVFVGDCDADDDTGIDDDNAVRTKIMLMVKEAIKMVMDLKERFRKKNSTNNSTVSLQFFLQFKIIQEITASNSCLLFFFLI